DGEAVLDREVEVRQRLRLDALRGVDQQYRAFAGGERARHLVGEVDVARRVDQVERVHLPVLGFVLHRDRVRLDRDALLALEVHGVQDLLLHLLLGERSGQLEETVGERRLAVVDVGDDAEVAGAFGRNPGQNRLALRTSRTRTGAPRAIRWSRSRRRRAAQ